jgi:hypothetical protein
MKYRIGLQGGDITDDFACYVLSQREFIKKYIKDEFCVDEILIQGTYLDICWAIDWTRGNPYVYTVEDTLMLMESGCLFARKFGFARDLELLDELQRMLCSQEVVEK